MNSYIQQGFTRTLGLQITENEERVPFCRVVSGDVWVGFAGLWSDEAQDSKRLCVSYRRHVKYCIQYDPPTFPGDPGAFRGLLFSHPAPKTKQKSGPKRWRN